MKKLFALALILTSMTSYSAEYNCYGNFMPKGPEFGLYILEASDQSINLPNLDGKTAVVSRSNAGEKIELKLERKGFSQVVRVNAGETISYSEVNSADGSELNVSCRPYNSN